MRLICIIRIPSLVVFNSGKQGTLPCLPLLFSVESEFPPRMKIAPVWDSTLLMPELVQTASASVSSFSGIAFSGHTLYNKAISRPYKGLADFLFCSAQMVLGFTKPCCYRLCRFSRRIWGNAHFMRVCGESYETACRLMTPEIAILTIKNSIKTKFSTL